MTTKVRLDNAPCNDGPIHDVDVTHEDAEVIQGTCTVCALAVDADKVPAS